MHRVDIIDGIRTPFCKIGTDFKDLSAQELGRVATRELLERTGIEARQIDEVVFGNVGQPADAANIARVIALLSGIPKTVPAYTVHRNCASGIEAAVQAAMKIQLGQGNCYIAGGTESMSNIPFYFSKELQDILTHLGRAKTLPQKLQTLIRLRPAYLKPRIGLEL